MILESIMDLVKTLINVIFSLLPNVPDFDITALESLTEYMDIIFSNLGLLGFFVRISTVKFLVPLVVIVVSFEHIYYLSLWVLKKIPFLGIE